MFFTLMFDRFVNGAQLALTVSTIGATLATFAGM